MHGVAESQRGELHRQESSRSSAAPRWSRAVAASASRRWSSSATARARSAGATARRTKCRPASKRPSRTGSAQHGRGRPSTAARFRTWCKGTLRRGRRGADAGRARHGRDRRRRGAGRVRSGRHPRHSHQELRLEQSGHRWSRPTIDGARSNCGTQQRRRAAAGSVRCHELCNDVNRGIHKHKKPQADRPRHRLGPRQDRRARPQGPGSRTAGQHPRDVRGRRDAAGAADSQARLQQPLGAEGRGGQRRRSDEAFEAGEEVTPGVARGEEPGQAAGSTCSRSWATAS